MVTVPVLDLPWDEMLGGSGLAAGAGRTENRDCEGRRCLTGLSAAWGGNRLRYDALCWRSLAHFPRFCFAEVRVPLRGALRGIDTCGDQVKGRTFQDLRRLGGIHVLPTPRGPAA